MSQSLSSRLIIGIGLIALGGLLLWLAHSSNTSTPHSTQPHATPAVKSVVMEPPPAPISLAPAQTFSQGARGNLQQREIESSAIVGSMHPSQPLPDEIGDCHWADSDEPRIACSMQILLPPGYFDDGRLYPVVYLLHGWGGWDVHSSNSEWNLYGTYQVADALMRAEQIPPFIIVAPEGGHAYWMNHAGDGARWADYVSGEVVPLVDANYRTLAARANRAIGGLSMGGLGAMQIALNHPDEFGVVALRSPTLRRIGDPDTPPFFGDADYYSRYDPFVLAERANALMPLATYILSGDQDAWLERTQAFCRLLDQKNARYELHVRSGGHDGDFFGSHLDEELHFYGAHLATR